jgi:hypothetical protein
MIIYISDIVDVKVFNQVIKLTVIQDLFFSILLFEETN